MIGSLKNSSIAIKFYASGQALKGEGEGGIWAREERGKFPSSLVRGQAPLFPSRSFLNACHACKVIYLWYKMEGVPIKILGRATLMGVIGTVNSLQRL